MKRFPQDGDWSSIRLPPILVAMSIWTETRSNEWGYLPRITVPPVIKGADVNFVSGLRGRGGLLIRLVRRAVTLSSKDQAGTTVAVADFFNPKYSNPANTATPNA